MFLYYYQINKGLKAAADKIFFQKLLRRPSKVLVVEGWLFIKIETEFHFTSAFDANLLYVTLICTLIMSLSLAWVILYYVDL